MPTRRSEIVVIGEDTLREILMLSEGFAHAMMKHKLLPDSLLHPYQLPLEDERAIALFLGNAPMLMAQLVEALISQQEMLRIVMFQHALSDDDTLQ